MRIAENLFWKFDQLGIRVLIADMPYYNSSNRPDVLIRQIREAIAEDNRKEIIERLCKGRQERVRKGKAPGGNAPYGYRRIDKRWIEDPAESKIVRLIFELSGLGYSSIEIAKGLAEEGYFQRNERPWTPRQVRSVIGRRELYESGIVRYGDVAGANNELILIDRNTVGDNEVGVGAALLRQS